MARRPARASDLWESPTPEPSRRRDQRGDAAAAGPGPSSAALATGQRCGLAARVHGEARCVRCVLWAGCRNVSCLVLCPQAPGQPGAVVQRASHQDGWRQGHLPAPGRQEQRGGAVPPAGSRFDAVNSGWSSRLSREARRALGCVCHNWAWGLAVACSQPVCLLPRIPTDSAPPASRPSPPRRPLSSRNS
jgi:hypothetical protein